MLSFNISYWDLIKFPYFADTTEREDSGRRRGWRQDDFTNNSIMQLVFLLIMKKT
jgi:hypothetical protein